MVGDIQIVVALFLESAIVHQMDTGGLKGGLDLLERAGRIAPLAPLQSVRDGWKRFGTMVL